MLRLTSCEFRMCSNNRKLHFVSHFTYKRIRNPLTQTGFHLHYPVKRVEGGFCWTVGLEINAEPRTLQLNTEIGQPQSAAKWTVPVLSLSLSLRVCPYLLREISRPHKTMWKTFVAQINHVPYPSCSLKISFQCLYPSLYFSLFLSLNISVSVLVSLCLLCGFSVLFLCYFVCLSSGFCFCASHGAFPRVFHLPMRRRRVVPKIVYCVLSVLFVFLLGFAFAKSSKQDNRARATGTQTRMQVPRFVYLSVCLSVWLAVCRSVFASYIVFKLFLFQCIFPGSAAHRACGFDPGFGCMLQA